MTGGFVITENLTEVFTVIADRLSRIEQRIPDALMDGVKMARELVMERIRRRGQNTAMVSMKTKSKKKTGYYSDAYGAKRERQGLTIGKVDMTFSGNMLNSLIVGLIGTSSSYMASPNEYKERIAGLEKYFGVFMLLTEDEKQKVYEQITDSIFKEIRGGTG